MVEHLEAVDGDVDELLGLVLRDLVLQVEAPSLCKQSEKVIARLIEWCVSVWLTYMGS